MEAPAPVDRRQLADGCLAVRIGGRSGEDAGFRDAAVVARGGEGSGQIGGWEEERGESAVGEAEDGDEMDLVGGDHGGLGGGRGMSAFLDR